MKIYKYLSNIKLFFLILLIFYLNSCGIYRPVDARKVSPNAKERVEKNIQEGRGYRLFGDNNKGGGTFEFASSNPMWRASIELLDFAPFSNVDYSGGIIITDWFTDENSPENEYLKITVKFLSNEVRADGLDIIIYKKNCDQQNKCNTTKLDSVLENEIKIAILKKAAEIEEDSLLKDPDYKWPKNL